MFIGREKELETLQSLYHSNAFQFPVIYGRRRVGKTYLISEFSKRLPTIYFTAIEGSPAANLENLARAIFSFEHPKSDLAVAPVFPSFQAAFEYIFDVAAAKRIVFVIDEYPYLAKTDKSISSILQMLIDRNKDSSRLFLILCGSSLSFMKEQVLGEKSPLYGRRTAQLEIRPLTFYQARKFLSSVPFEDFVNYYGMAGGIPLYLQQFCAKENLHSNIANVFLNTSSLLYEEPLNLLKQEVQKAAVYNAVIAAIAGGKTTNNEIATTVGMSTAELSYYLKELQNIGLVEKEEPAISKGHRPLYRLTDNLFRFWYRFVSPNRTLIERGLATHALSRIEEQLPLFTGQIFEQCCQDWLWQKALNEQLPFEFNNIGRWWGGNPATKHAEEIDIVCTDQGRIIALGECKWTNEPADISTLEKLRERARIVSAPPNVHLLLFSKTGFSLNLFEEAKNDTSLRLISLEDMEL